MTEMTNQALFQPSTDTAMVFLPCG